MIGRGRFDAADGVADGGEVDDVAGLDEGGGVRCSSHIGVSVVPISCQPPELCRG